MFLGAPHADSRIGKEITAARALLAVARAFDTGAPAPDAGEVAVDLGVSADDVSEVFVALRGTGLVVPLGDGGLVPGRPLEKITLLDVRRALSGKEAPLGAGTGLVAAIVRGIEDEGAERLADVSYRTLCDRERGADGQAGTRPEGVEAGQRPVQGA